MPAAPIIIGAAVASGAAAAIGTAIVGASVFATAVGTGVIAGTLTAVQGGSASDVLKSAVLSGVGAQVGSMVSSAVTSSVSSATGTTLGSGVSAGAGATTGVTAGATSATAAGLGTGIAAGTGATLGAGVAPTVFGALAGNMAGRAVEAAITGKPIDQALLTGVAQTIPFSLGQSADFRALPQPVQNVLSSTAQAAVMGQDVETAALSSLLQSTQIVAKAINEVPELGKLIQDNPTLGRYVVGATNSALMAKLLDKDVNDAVIGSLARTTGQVMADAFKAQQAGTTLSEAQKKHQQLEGLQKETNTAAEKVNGIIKSNQQDVNDFRYYQDRNNWLRKDYYDRFDRHAKEYADRAQRMRDDPFWDSYERQFGRTPEYYDEIAANNRAERDKYIPDINAAVEGLNSTYKKLEDKGFFTQYNEAKTEFDRLNGQLTALSGEYNNFVNTLSTQSADLFNKAGSAVTETLKSADPQETIGSELSKSDAAVQAYMTSLAEGAPLSVAYEMAQRAFDQEIKNKESLVKFEQDYNQRLQNLTNAGIDITQPLYQDRNISISPDLIMTDGFGKQTKITPEEFGWRTNQSYDRAISDLSAQLDPEYKQLKNAHQAWLDTADWYDRNDSDVSKQSALKTAEYYKIAAQNRLDALFAESQQDRSTAPPASSAVVTPVTSTPAPVETPIAPSAPRVDPFEYTPPAPVTPTIPAEVPPTSSVDQDLFNRIQEVAARPDITVPSDATQVAQAPTEGPLRIEITTGQSRSIYISPDGRTSINGYGYLFQDGEAIRQLSAKEIKDISGLDVTYSSETGSYNVRPSTPGAPTVDYSLTATDMQGTPMGNAPPSPTTLFNLLTSGAGSPTSQNRAIFSPMGGAGAGGAPQETTWSLVARAAQTGTNDIIDVGGKTYSLILLPDRQVLVPTKSEPVPVFVELYQDPVTKTPIMKEVEVSQASPEVVKEVSKKLGETAGGAATGAEGATGGREGVPGDAQPAPGTQTTTPPGAVSGENQELFKGVSGDPADVYLYDKVPTSSGTGTTTGATGTAGATGVPTTSGSTTETGANVPLTPAPAPELPTTTPSAPSAPTGTEGSSTTLAGGAAGTGTPGTPGAGGFGTGTEPGGGEAGVVPGGGTGTGVPGGTGEGPARGEEGTGTGTGTEGTGIGQGGTGTGTGTGEGDGTGEGGGQPRPTVPRQQPTRQAALMGGLSAFLGSRAPSASEDQFGPFRPITTGGPTEEFKGPLQEFLEKVEGQSYTGQDPFMALEGQKTETPKTDMNVQPAPSYFNYGKPSEIDDTLNIARSIDSDIASALNPLGGFNSSRTSYFKAGGLSTPLFNQGGTTRYGRYAGGGLNVVHHSGKPRIDFREGDAVTGPGDGQSDDIPAMLADGEFVFPADVVAALGNGSTKAGSDKLYDMMHSIRAQARSAHPKDLPPPAKSPLDYLKNSPKKGSKDQKARR